MKKLFMLSFSLIFIYCNVNAQLKMISNGKIAVGDVSATPSYLLDLIGGDINTQSAYGYRINSNYVLWNNSHPEDIFVGEGAGNATMTEHYHTYVGNLAGHANTTGKYNSFIGYASGYNNTTGRYNTAIGHTALASNTTGSHNTIIGYTAGYATTGSSNTFIGSLTGYSNTSGNGNTALGTQSGQSNTTGINNTHLGYYAGQGNTTGGYNTCVGYYAGQSNTTGSNNTYLGYNANGNANNYSNSTAVGNGTIFSGSNYVFVGNTAITQIKGQVNFTTYSDGRFKTNIQENVKGLEFINKLRPITYQVNTKQLDDFIIQNMPDSIKTLHQTSLDFAPSSSMIRSGFIAQEVDSVANLCGFVSSIVQTPENNTDPYGLSYSEMVVPLVKAVQELSKKLDSLQVSNILQQSQIVQLQHDLIACCNKPINTTKIGENNNDGQQFNEHSISVDLVKEEQIILYQNEPNPFNNSTVIRYFIPENMQIEAYIMFYDSYGKDIKKVDVKETGAGKIEANTQNIAAGIYSYSLIVNGKVVDTKKMMKNK